MTKSDSKTRSPRKILACLLAIPLGLVLTDILVGEFYLAKGRYLGPPLPPYDVADSVFLRRWFTKQRQVLLSTPPDEDIRGSYDQELGWRRPSPARPQREAATRKVWNTRGDRAYPERPAPGSVRLVGFGDSFLLGSEVSDQETIGAQLELMEPNVEFMNFGVAGYGLDQALLYFRMEIERLHADVVVVDVHVDCVRRLVTRCRSWQQPTAKLLLVKPRFRLEGGELVLVPLPFQTNRELLTCALAGELETRLGEHEHWLGDAPLFPHSALERIRAAYAANARREYESLWLDREGDAYQLTLAVLEAFRAEAMEAGASKFLILLFSNFRDYPRRDPTAGVDFLRPLRGDLDRRHFDVLDFDRSMAEEMNPRLHGRNHVFHSTHLNARGNQLVAQTMQQWLRESELLPHRDDGESGQ